MTHDISDFFFFGTNHLKMWRRTIQVPICWKAWAFVLLVLEGHQKENHNFLGGP